MFAVAFVAIQVGRALFMLWAARSDTVLAANFQRILIWAVLSGVFWIGADLQNPSTD